jgi:hypothetical protein
MQKLLKVFLISITLLTFSNVASASFFGDIAKSFKSFGDFFSGKERHGKADNVRCKVEYTRLDLNTGIEKNVKHTVQHEAKYMAREEDACYLSTQYASDKINDWLNKGSNNVIVDLSVINCKTRRPYSTNPLYPLEYRWNEYKSCDDEFNINLVDWLDRPKQWGFNVNKERLIRNYEEGFKNINGDDPPFQNFKG